jgi:hypothetical protein
MEYANYARYLEESLGYSDATLDTLSKVWRIESIKTLLKMLALRPELTVKEPFLRFKRENNLQKDFLKAVA